MLLFIQIFVLLLGCAVFVCPLKYKLCILFISYICFSSIFIEFIPFGKSEYFLSICFFISELPRLTEILKQLKQSIMYKLLFMMIIATIILAIFSPHYHDAYNIIRLCILELFGKYFVIAYAFICIKKEKDFKVVLKFIGMGLFFITLFGLQNYFAKQSWWFHIALPYGTKIIDQTGFEMSNRFRVQSMFINPFDYGYACVLIHLLYIYSYYKKYIKKTMLLLASFGCIFGIVFCGCRTVMVVYVISIMTFYYIYKVNRLRLVLTIGVIVIGGIILTSKISNNETIESYSRIFETDVATNGSNGYGSSIGMRILQLNAVLYNIQGFVLFGRGKDFFNIDMGWADGGKSTLIDKDLWGLEGLYLNHLLERGIVGLVFWVIFYGNILFFLYRRKCAQKEEVAVGLSVLMAYVFFSNMTGELGSVFPTLLILGSVLKTIYIKKVKS